MQFRALLRSGSTRLGFTDAAGGWAAGLESERSRAALEWLLVLAALSFLVLDLYGRQLQIDDSYITYRYARNLVDGAGLVFNPGERVEGITSLLWTLLIAAGLELGVDASVTGPVLGLLCSAATVVLTYALARLWLPARVRWLAGFAPWLVVASFPFCIWSTSGMETPLFALTTTAVWLTSARGWRWGTAAGLMVGTLVRPEAGLLAAVLLGLPLLWGREARARAWAPLLTYAVFVLLLTAFRLAYYGSPVPNTFYAKVGGIPFAWGTIYLLRFLHGGVAWLVVPVAVALLSSPPTRYAGFYCLLHTAYVVAIGGDGLNYSRFFVHLVPLISVLALVGVGSGWLQSPARGVLLAALVAAYGVRSVLGSDGMPLLLALAVFAVLAAYAYARRVAVRWSPWDLAAGMIAGVCGIFSVVPTALVPPLVTESGSTSRLESRAESFQSLERFLGFFAAVEKRKAVELLSRDPKPRLVASISIGILGWESRLPIIDMLGLVTPEVARARTPLRGFPLPGHQRSNSDYVLARAPDYIFVPEQPLPVELSADRELRMRSEFQREYLWDPAALGWRRTTVR